MSISKLLSADDIWRLCWFLRTAKGYLQKRYSLLLQRVLKGGQREWYAENSNLKVTHFSCGQNIIIWTIIFIIGTQSAKRGLCIVSTDWRGAICKHHRCSSNCYSLRLRFDIIPPIRPSLLVLQEPPISYFQKTRSSKDECSTGSNNHLRSIDRFRS